MNKISRIIVLSLSFFASVTFAGAEGYKVLFGNENGNLSAADKEEIFQILGYSVTPDGKGLTSKDCGEVSFEPRVVDLNGDGTPEVFVISGNTCTSGNTGVSIDLFVKGSDGKYRKQLGFPAIDYEVMKEQNKGYPDLMFGGPGFCHGVWRWDGAKYEYYCSRESQPGACGRKGVKNVCKSERSDTSVTK